MKSRLLWQGKNERMGIYFRVVVNAEKYHPTVHIERQMLYSDSITGKVSKQWEPINLATANSLIVSEVLGTAFLALEKKK